VLTVGWLRARVHPRPRLSNGISLSGKDPWPQLLEGVQQRVLNYYGLICCRVHCATYLKDIAHNLRTVNSYIARKQTYHSFVKRKCFIGIMRSILLLASLLAKFYSRVYPQIPFVRTIFSENKSNLQKFSVGKNEVGNFLGCPNRLMFVCISA
jgi:hypothetical protein